MGGASGPCGCYKRRMARHTETLKGAAVPLTRRRRDARTRYPMRVAQDLRKPWIIDYQDVSNDVFFVVSGTAPVKI